MKWEIIRPVMRPLINDPENHFETCHTWCVTHYVSPFDTNKWVRLDCYYCTGWIQKERIAEADSVRIQDHPRGRGERVTPTREVGTPTYCLANILLKTAWKWKIINRRGGSTHHRVNPWMRQYNDFTVMSWKFLKSLNHLNSTCVLTQSAWSLNIGSQEFLLFYGNCSFFTRVFPKIDHSGNIARIVLGLKFVFLIIW